MSYSSWITIMMIMESKESRVAVMIRFVFSESNPSESFLQIHSLFQCKCVWSHPQIWCKCVSSSNIPPGGIKLRLPPLINLPFMNFMSSYLFFYNILFTVTSLHGKRAVSCNKAITSVSRTLKIMKYMEAQKTCEP